MVNHFLLVSLYQNDCYLRGSIPHCSSLLFYVGQLSWMKKFIHDDYSTGCFWWPHLNSRWHCMGHKKHNQKLIPEKKCLWGLLNFGDLKWGHRQKKKGWEPLLWCKDMYSMVTNVHKIKLNWNLKFINIWQNVKLKTYRTQTLLC